MEQQIQDLLTRISNLESQNHVLTNQVSAYESRIIALESKVSELENKPTIAKFG